MYSAWCVRSTVVSTESRMGTYYLLEAHKKLLTQYGGTDTIYLG